MPDFTKDSLIPSHAQKQITCALTGDTIAKGDACFWIQAVGIVRGDLDPDEVVAKLVKFNGMFPAPSPFPSGSVLVENVQESIDEGIEQVAGLLAAQTVSEVSYQDLCECLAQEFEAALVELKRRGIDHQFDDESLKEYRALHPRQDA